ncbi:N-acetylmuramoyl-L-alanine amidase [Streptomyces anulatus]|uniref:peptidoglycan recognition protein family protein n=1 Tax=Streptomyces anulatus TaxID=1892 RepID=UPI002E0F9939|nr:N-acetylmuramoyl-L-alanine amidase [Streptomyces anulatus]WSI77943.1 N-acetylmuramoyl-L-alanine amidase [Streptomyces anulatus]
MKFVTRSQLGWPKSAAGYIGSVRGVKVHYLGTPYSSRPHGKCAAYVKGIRSSHLANKAENYSDIAYNALVCEHGTVFEGRGPHRRTGANGNASLNSQHYAVCGLLGSSGLTTPPDAMLSGIRDAIEYLRKQGDAGSEIKAHRDGYPTSCPGGPLYAWVQKGAPRPKAEPDEPDTPAPTEPTAPAVKEETPMPAPKAITESVPASDRLPAGEYTLIKLAEDTAALQGPCTYVVTAYATVVGIPGTRVVARFHDLPLSTGRPSLDLPIDGGVIGPDGTLDLSVTRNGGLDAKEQLRLELRADADATVTRRVLRALRTDA